MCTATPPGRRQSIWASDEVGPGRRACPGARSAPDDQLKSKSRRSSGTAFMSTERDVHPPPEVVRRAQARTVECFGPVRPRGLAIRPARGRCAVRRLVGGDDVTPLGREQGHQGVLADAEAEATTTGGQHPALAQRLGDEEPLPHLAVQHHLALVPVAPPRAGAAGRPRPAARGSAATRPSTVASAT